MTFKARYGHEQMHVNVGKNIFPNRQRIHEWNPALDSRLLCFEDVVPQSDHFRENVDSNPQTLKTVATCSSETSTPTYNTTECKNPDDHSLGYYKLTAEVLSLSTFMKYFHYNENSLNRSFLIREASTRAISLPQISGLIKTADLPTRAKQCVNDRQAPYLEQKRTQCQFVKKIDIISYNAKAY